MDMPYIPLYIDTLDAINLIDNIEVTGEAFIKVAEYCCEGVHTPCDNAKAEKLYNMIMEKVQQAQEKYDDVCEKRRQASRKRWNNANDNQENTKSNASGMQMDTKSNASGMQTKLNETKTKLNETKTKVFKAPTLEEVQQYCNERGNNVDARKFIDYYISNGWKVGKNPMKDWKACVRNWERSQYGNETPKKEGSFDTNEYFGMALAKARREMA